MKRIDFRPEVLRVARAAERLSVRVLLADETFIGLPRLSAPAHDACIVMSRTRTNLMTVVWADNDSDAACGLLHEVVHAFIGEDPDQCDEMGAFLAVEYAVINPNLGPSSVIENNIERSALLDRIDFGSIRSAQAQHSRRGAPPCAVKTKGEVR